jgi:hypothetical protein
MTDLTYPEQPPAATLWQMKPHEFNEWRATHDLPALFEFLAGLLPSFEEWQASLPFGQDIMLRAVSTAQFFTGDSTKTVVKREVDAAPGKFNYSCATTTEMKAFRANARFIPYEVVGEFLPYFVWAKKHLGRGRFFVWDPLNNQKSDTFLYGSWRGDPKAEGGEGRSAILFRGFPVLKLGETVLTRTNIDGRNLDFVNLDHLTLDGKFFGSGWKYIHFSSCKSIRLTNAEAWFFTFDQCVVDTIYIENSKIQDFYFDNIGNLTMSLTSSYVYRLGITNTGFVPFIKDCELREISFIPSKALPPGVMATTYRMLRAAYQAAGQRQEASECYYNERKFERKSFYRPYGEYSGPFPRLPYRGQFSEARRNFEKGYFDKAKLRSIYLLIVRARLNILRRPGTLFMLLRSKIRWLVSLFEELLWGYGERPMRIVLCMALAIMTYAWAYHALPWPTLKNAPAGWLDDFYFSAVTFTTLGYGDILPATGVLKLVCASEALVGGLSLGLIVAGFSNKGRY